MTNDNSSNVTQDHGVSGFIELAGRTLLVDFGKVYHDDALVGRLYEDGLIVDGKGLLSQVAPAPQHYIDDINGIFRGIDLNGQTLELPGNQLGPTGDLLYNGRKLSVMHGRVASEDHRFLALMDDAAQLLVRQAEGGRVALDEHSLLSMSFSGEKSDRTPWTYEFNRPLHRKDQSYAANEVIRYFSGFNNLSMAQKRYVIETMSMWAACGILQVVRRSEGDCSLGNVRHGAAGVTGVRTGNVTLDKEEFEREIELYQQFGALAVISKGIRNLTEVRINLVVAHEFGHQLEFALTQEAQEHIADLYDKKRKLCEKVHPLPENYPGFAELLNPQEVLSRHFLSGYSRTSAHEYWAECVAAFSVKESRDKLKETDSIIHNMLSDIVLRPETILQRTLRESITLLQASLRLGGQFDDQLLERY